MTSLFFAASCTDSNQSHSQMLDLLRSAIDLEEKLMSSTENLNKLSSSPSSNPSHGTETAETAGSAETAQESNASGEAAGLETRLSLV